jgi:hypothetical protein
MVVGSDYCGAISSAGEHCLHTAGVTGSIPVSPTRNLKDILMLRKKYSLGMLLILLVSNTVWTQTTNQFINTENLPDFKTILRTLKEKTQLPVIFPQKIPALGNLTGYYIYTEAESGTSHYLISMDKTADCHGKHNCTIGSLFASVGGIPQIYYSTDNKELTVPVDLVGGKKGYFTPSHAMADFWAPQIEWRDGNILYRLSWNLAANVPEKEALVAMANSITKY